MAKPSTIPLWATDATVSGGAENGLPTRVNPAAATNQGWKSNTTAPARWANWLHGLAGDWFTYLNNLHGETEFLNKNYGWSGSHTFGGAGFVTIGNVGGLILNSPSVFNGGVTFNNATNLFLGLYAQSADDSVVFNVSNTGVLINAPTKSVSIDSTLAVSGNVGTIGGEFLYLNGAGTPTPRSRSGYLNLAQNTKLVGAANAEMNTSGQLVLSSGAAIAINLPSGGHLKNCLVTVLNSAGGAQTVQVRIYERNYNTATTTTIFTQSTAIADASTALFFSVADFSHTIDNTNCAYYMQVARTAGSVGNFTVQAASVVYDEPGPRNF